MTKSQAQTSRVLVVMGFKKDSIHFYWFARHLVKNTRERELCMTPDQRFVHVMHILKLVRNWVSTDRASWEEEM